MASPTPAVDRPQLPSRRQQILELRGKLGQRDPHELLGLAPDADARSAHAAFQTLAKRFHPDALGPSDADLRGEAQEIFMAISAAYDAVRAGLASRPAMPIVRPVSKAAAAVERPVERPVERAVERPVERPRARIVDLPVARLEIPAEGAGAGAVPDVAARPRWREVEAAIEEAEQQLAQNEPSAAIEALHPVLRLANDRQRGRVRLLLATAYLSQPGKRRNALVLLNELVSAQPTNAEALALLGTLYRREGLLARAESLLARAVAADPCQQQARAGLRAVRDTLNGREAAKPRQSPSGGLFGRLLLMVR